MNNSSTFKRGNAWKIWSHKFQMLRPTFKCYLFETISSHESFKCFNQHSNATCLKRFQVMKVSNGSTNIQMVFLVFRWSHSLVQSLQPTFSVHIKQPPRPCFGIGSTQFLGALFSEVSTFLGVSGILTQPLWLGTPDFREGMLHLRGRGWNKPPNIKQSHQDDSTSNPQKDRKAKSGLPLF